MLKEMSMAELEKRMADIVAEIDDEDADLDSLENEAKEIKEEIEERKNVEMKKNEIRSKVANGEGIVIRTFEEEEEKPQMTNVEVRNSKEYIDAFANYIKTGKDNEVRALLTENVENGVVPVPTFVESRIRNAWERDEIFNRVTKTYVRGNLKVGFEVASSDAQIHVEGTDAPAEEVLTLGIVQLVPQTIKKWITFSDEVMALGSEEFLAYIYDELTYKIIKKAVAEIIRIILAAPTVSNELAVGVPSVNNAGSIEGVIEAMSHLGADARDIVFIANAKTIASYKQLQFGYSFPVDPFQGATVITTDNIADDKVIIGDLSGVQANMPEGQSVRFVFDEYSLAEKDLIKLVGRLLVAIGIVEPKMLVTIKTA